MAQGFWYSVIGFFSDKLKMAKAFSKMMNNDVCGY